MRGDEHYREAERLLGAVEPLNSHDERDIGFLLAALTHATLAHTAAVAESASSALTGVPLASRPSPATDGDPAYPGSPWGRALYGDLHITNDKD